MANPLRVNTVEFQRRPGLDRELDITVAFSTFGVEDDRVLPDAPVHVRMKLESLNDGLTVAGTITTDWHGSCRRCAIDVGGQLVADVEERYQERVTDPDAFEFDGTQLDLEPMVREVILLEAPSTPLCREDCQGLCPTCGIDLNTATCNCEAAPVDLRWDALDQLRDSAREL